MIDTTRNDDELVPCDERDERIAALIHEWNTMPEAEWREMLRNRAEQLDAFLRERRNSKQ